MSALASLFLKYLESHPEQIEQLIGALLQALVQHASNQSKS